MLRRIRARDLDFDSSSLRPIRDTYPSIPCESKWIDGVRNHGSTETEIIFGDHVTNAIARIIERVADDSRIADGLLHRVDAQIYRTKLAS